MNIFSGKAPSKRLVAAVQEKNPPLFTRRDLLRLFIPLVIEQTLAITIGMADTVMVTSVGEAAVSGISLVDSINILLIQIFAALAGGGAIVAAQYIGRRDTESGCTAAKQLLYSTTFLALVIMVASLIFNRPILHGVFGNIDADVMANAETYFWLSALSYPFLAVYNGGAALFRAMGNSRVSLFTSVLMNVVNISGNAILIYGFQWGVAGAGTATLLSRALGAVVMMILIVKPANVIHVKKLFRPEIHLAMVKNILKLAIPNGMENGMFQVGKLIVQGLISSFGTAAIAANAIGNSLASMANIPGAAMGLGLVTVVGQCVGAKDYVQTVKYTKKIMAVTYLSLGVFNVLLFLFVEPMVGLFHLSDEAARQAVEILRLFNVFALFFWPSSFTLPNALRAAGDAKFTMTVSMLSMWIFRVGFSYILGQYLQMGLVGVWLAMIIDWIVRSGVFLFRFVRGRWKSIRVID